MDIHHHVPSEPLSPPSSPLALAPGEPIWIRDADSLSLLSELLVLHEEVGLDTETGAPLPDLPLNDTLSLIQLYVPGVGGDVWSGQVYLIDVLALEKTDNDTVLTPLKEYLEDSTYKKIIHHAAFEREQFRRYGISLAGVVDTETLSRRARPDLRSHSLAACMSEIVLLPVDKGEQKSDWLSRPLTKSQEIYAATDPFANMVLYEKLKEFSAAAYCRDFEKLSFEELIELLSEAEGKLREVRRPIANKYYSLDRVASLLRDEAKDILKKMYSERGEEFAFSFPHGSAGVSVRGDEVLDREKLSLLHPELHKSLPLYTCTQVGLKQLLKEAGIKGREASKVIDDVVVEKELKLKVVVDIITISHGSNVIRDVDEEAIAEIEKILVPLLRPDLRKASLEVIADEILSPADERSANTILKQLRAMKEAGEATSSHYLNRALSLEDQLQRLLEGIIDVERSKNDLLRGDAIGNLSAPYLLRGAILRDRIAQKAIEDGAPTGVMKTSFGAVTLESQSKRVVDVKILEERYGSLFELGRKVGAIIDARPSKSAIKEFFLEKGLNNQEQEELTDALFICGSNKKTPIPYVAPRYSLLFS